MNRLCFTSGLIMAFCAGIHTFMGGPEVHQALLAAMPSAELSLYASVLWHFATLALVAMAAALIWASLDFANRKPMAIAVTVLATGFGLLFLGYGLTRLGSALIAPQWALFFPVTALMGIALVRHQNRTAP